MKSHRGLWLGLAISAVLHVSAGFVATSYPIGTAGSTPRNHAGADEGMLLALEQPNPDPALPPNDPAAAALVTELMKNDPTPQPPPLPTPPPTPEHKLVLGIDESDLKTPNWLGDKNPTEHKAKLSSVEQPQLDPNPGAPGSPGVASAPDHPAAPAHPELTPSPATAQTPPTPPTPPAPEAQPPTVPPMADQPPQPPQPEPVRPDPAQPESPLSKPPQPEQPQPRQPQPEQTPREGDEGATGEKLIEHARVTPLDTHQDPTLSGPPAPAATSDRISQSGPERLRANPSLLPPERPRMIEPVAPMPRPEQAQAAIATFVGPPSPLTPATNVPEGAKSESPTSGTPGGDHSGIKSEKEADASSTTPTLEIRPGRPAAAKGLDITTKRPLFTRLTRVTAYPENPLLKVTFNRSGVVSHVQLMESSGIPDVDGPVINAIYQWTARGKQLTELVPGEANSGLTIEVRILLR